jgi:hypothetical protein
MDVCARSCTFSTSTLSEHYRRTGSKGLLRRGFPKTDTTEFDFCRFCHFRVLTAKMVSHITRLADADGLAARRSAIF